MHSTKLHLLLESKAKRVTSFNLIQSAFVCVWVCLTFEYVAQVAYKIERFIYYAY